MTGEGQMIVWTSAESQTMMGDSDWDLKVEESASGNRTKTGYQKGVATILGL